MRRIALWAVAAIAVCAAALAVASPAKSGIIGPTNPYPWVVTQASAWVNNGQVVRQVAVTNVDDQTCIPWVFDPYCVMHPKGVSHTASVTVYGLAKNVMTPIYSGTVTVAPHQTKYLTYVTAAHPGYSVGITISARHIWEATDPLGALMLPQSDTAWVTP